MKIKFLVYYLLFLFFVSCNRPNAEENTQILSKHFNGIPSKVKIINSKDSTVIYLEYHSNGILKEFKKYKADSIPFEKNYSYREDGAIRVEEEWVSGKLKTKKRFFSDIVFFDAYKEDGQADFEAERTWDKENGCNASTISFNNRDNGISKDTLKIGKEFVAKLFLRNAKAIYSNFNLIPTIKFNDRPKKRGNVWEEMERSELSVMKDDTGYVKFKVKDDPTLVKGSNDRYWEGYITVHKPQRDTNFIMRYDYIILK